MKSINQIKTKCNNWLRKKQLIVTTVPSTLRRMTVNDKDYVRQEFASRFRQALTELGYSVNDGKRMKELFGVSRQSACKWANGISLPASARIPRIAAALGVRRAWLMDGENPMRPAIGKASNRVSEPADTHYEKLILSEDEVKLICCYRALSIEQKKTIHKTATLFSNKNGA